MTLVSAHLLLVLYEYSSDHIESERERICLMSSSEMEHEASVNFIFQRCVQTLIEADVKCLCLMFIHTDNWH